MASKVSPAGSSFLGTFDRRVAVDDETIDFYASGHSLGEGLLAHLEDSALGRAGLQTEVLSVDAPEAAPKRRLREGPG